MSPGTVDVRMHGRARTTAAYLVVGSEATALIDTGPASSIDVTVAELERLGVERLDWIVLTHIHLDHAGACGALAALHPNAQVAVHPRGARHIVDPSRLWEGVRSIYGEHTDRLWGRPEPVAADRVHAIADGASIDIGDRQLTALETPGHARHHHTWLDSKDGSAFVGDAIGMQVGQHELWRATTPPPDFSRDAAIASIERIRAARPRQLWLGHFGAATAGGDATAVDSVLDACRQTLDDWTAAIGALHRSGKTGVELSQAVRGWLAEQESGWPPQAGQALDETSEVAVDVAGVVGWLEREQEASPR